MGLIIDEILNRKKLVEDQNILPTFSIIPILVTTAKLFLANTDVESININSGNYESNFSYKPVEWVILSYPYTPSLHQTAQRLEINIPEYRNFESRGLHTKEGIIVVTVSGLVSFIDKLNSLAK